MPKNLRWKVPLILVVLVLSAWFAFPLDQKINLGLDLKGGMHLLLRVDTSQLTPEQQRYDVTAQAVEVIRNRINQFGVEERGIQRQGTDHIIVQLPGVTDRERAKALIGRTALLEFRLVSEDPVLTDRASKGEMSQGYDWLESKEGGHLLLEREGTLTGSILSTARATPDPQGMGGYAIEFEMNREGSRTFGRLTGDHINRRLAIVLDGVVQSAPVIKSQITDRGSITSEPAGFAAKDAEDLAIVLRTGALPAPLVIEEERTVGPTLGQDSIRAGLKATAIGGIVVAFFMLGYYWLAGLFADVALALNLLIILGAMGYFKATLTMPGIAGMVLTLGMAVDANVLINERIREELKGGKSLATAIKLGYERAWSAILDSNVTTLIAAALLFQFGTGPVKGFGVTLTIGLLASMFTAIVVTRVLLDVGVGMGWIKSLPMLDMMRWLLRLVRVFKRDATDVRLDFIGKRRLFYVLSLVLTTIGLAAFFARGERAYGIDFTGGQIQEYRFDQRVSVDQVRASLSQVGLGDAVIQEYAESNEILIRTPGDTSAQVAEAFKKDLPDRKMDVLRIEQVGPIAGRQLRQQAFWALALALLGILLYVAFRFKHWDFGTAGVIALIHDVLIAVGYFGVAGRQLSLTGIAALLTVAGYSINDTIVIYDRVRENLRQVRGKTSLADVLNMSVNQMLARTLLTSATVIFELIVLCAFGGEVLADFSWALLVGSITGVYSTVYIAGALVITWRSWRRPAVVKPA